MIELRYVTKHFGSQHVLKDVSGTVARGEVAVVCGPSGSGKSTLIRTINRLEEMDGGQILLDGQDIHEPAMDIDALRMRVGFVFQQFNPFRIFQCSTTSRWCLSGQSVRRPVATSGDRSQPGDGASSHAFR